MGSVEDAKAALQAASDVAAAVAELPVPHPSRSAHDRPRRPRRPACGGFEQFLVLETGKPLKDCQVEVDRTLVTLTAAAEEVARIHGETVPMDLLPSGDGLLGFWTRVPIGVVVGIAGFNYPLLLATHKIAPADRRGLPGGVQAGTPDPVRHVVAGAPVPLGGRRHGAPRAMVQLVTGDAAVGSALVTEARGRGRSPSRDRQPSDTGSPAMPPDQGAPGAGFERRAHRGGRRRPRRRGGCRRPGRLLRVRPGVHLGAAGPRRGVGGRRVPGARRDAAREGGSGGSPPGGHRRVGLIDDRSTNAWRAGSPRQ